MKKVKILSIDGGGIRGILPGTILTRLEQTLQKHDNSSLRLADYFDFIAGTSTGGILSCLYLMPDENGKPKYSAEQALELYVKHGAEIFDRTLLRRLTSGEGIIHEKYSDHAIYKLFEEYFGDETLDNLVKPCLITSYDITDRKSVFFTSVDAKTDAIYNFKVKDVARATSAAPTYFQPAHIKSMSDQLYTLVDGGMFANNPALCAYAEARKTSFGEINKPTAKEMIIVSLGTGSVKKQYHYSKFRSAGEITWLEPVIDILMSGSSETVDYQLKQMYLTLDSPADQKDYYRLEPGLKEACSEIDIATDENINNLYQAGLSYVRDHAQMINEIALRILNS